MNFIDNLLVVILIVSTIRMAWVKFWELRAENSGVWGIFFTPAHYVVYILAHVIGYSKDLKRTFICMGIWFVGFMLVMLFGLERTQVVMNTIFTGGTLTILVLTFIRFAVLRMNNQL